MTKPQDTNSTESHHSDLKQLRCPSGLRGTTQVRVAVEPAAGEKIPLVAPFLFLSSARSMILHTSSPLRRARRIASPFLVYPSSSSSSSLFSAFPTSRCASRVRVVILHARSPSSPLLLSEILHTHPKKKRKGEERKKEGGVGGLPPTFKLFSPLSPTIRQKHSHHTETRRSGIVARLNRKDIT